MNMPEYEHVSPSWSWYNVWPDDFAKQCIKNKAGNCFCYAAVFYYIKIYTSAGGATNLY